MKYTHLYQDNNSFENDYTNNYVEPWVSLTESTGDVNYNKQDPANGHPYVDLGLPSGTLWATCNVGASSPEERGDYYAGGEITPKSEYSGSNYTFGDYEAITKYNNTDGKLVLDAEDDAAYMNMGGNWHMPTKTQFEELVANTNGLQTTDYNNTGVAGVVLTSTINGNSIFFPNTGHKEGVYLNDEDEGYVIGSSNIDSGGQYTYAGMFDNYESMPMYLGSRNTGCPVRGVIG